MSEEPTVFLVDDDPIVLRSLTGLVKVVFPRVEAFSSCQLHDCLIDSLEMDVRPGLHPGQHRAQRGHVDPHDVDPEDLALQCGCPAAHEWVKDQGPWLSMDYVQDRADHLGVELALVWVDPVREILID